uniref:UBL3-like ubiquitin domain-containing protein n=1 Tax=Spongospora subterranea TaxID=70186 RepID=A0A0H5QLS7_9EUKA|eukprot:CRZ02296.1 hypothetical protein [Spongospora subterranea]
MTGRPTLTCRILFANTELKILLSDIPPEMMGCDLQALIGENWPVQIGGPLGPADSQQITMIFYGHRIVNDQPLHQQKLLVERISSILVSRPPPRRRRFCSARGSSWELCCLIL